MMNSSTIARTLQECSLLFGIEQISRRFVGRSEEEDGAQSRKLSRIESGDGGTEAGEANTNVFYVSGTSGENTEGNVRKD